MTTEPKSVNPAKPKVPDDDLIALLGRLFPEITKHKLLTGEDHPYATIYTSALAIAEKRGLKIPHLETKDQDNEQDQSEPPEST